MFDSSFRYAVTILRELSKLDPAAYMYAADLCSKSKLPPAYTAKIMQDLTRLGILESRKGPSGGFRLSKPANEIPIFDIAKHFGYQDAQVDWLPTTLRQQIVKFVQKGTVAEVL